MKGNNKNIAAGVFAVLLSMSFAGSWKASAQSGNAAAIYKARCTPCHGPDGKGNTPAGKSLGATDLTKSANAKVAELKTAIEKGKNKMPAYGKTLKAGEIDDLVSYIRSLK